jgi:hypothetical protein
MSLYPEFSPRILLGPPCPVGDDSYACKSCGAIVAEQDIVRHTHWHERLRRSVDEADGTID